jgi:hypothetical protein
VLVSAVLVIVVVVVLAVAVPSTAAAPVYPTQAKMCVM